MEFDERITDISKIMNCFTTEDAKRYLHTHGYFADHIEDFWNLNDIDMLELTGFQQEFKYPYCVDGDSFKFFLPCAFVAEEKEKKEKKYRALTIDEFLDKFHIGEVIVFRSKVMPNIVCHILFDGYIEEIDKETFVILGLHRYPLKELFSSYECFYNGRWVPFGVKVEG